MFGVSGQRTGELCYAVIGNRVLMALDHTPLKTNGLPRSHR